jgi:predicted acyl esterase
MMREGITNMIRTFKAVSPILGRAVKSGQLLSSQCDLTEPDPDILCEYDVEIPMSEGFSLAANIYGSKKAAEENERVPVVMCAHPYDNHFTAALKKTPLEDPPQQ